MRAISLVATFVASVGLALLVDAWIIATYHLSWVAFLVVSSGFLTCGGIVLIRAIKAISNIWCDTGDDLSTTHYWKFGTGGSSSASRREVWEHLTKSSWNDYQRGRHRDVVFIALSVVVLVPGIASIWFDLTTPVSYLVYLSMAFATFLIATLPAAIVKVLYDMASERR